MPTLFSEENGEVGVIAVLRRRFATRDGAVLFEARDKKQWANAAGAQKHAELLITKRLRANAAAIRFGDEPAVLPPARPEPNRNYYKHPAERHVLFLRPVRYTRGGRPVLCNAWTTRVPVPVADAAIKQGLALLADTDEAREKMREMSERRRRIPQRLGPAVTIEDTVDLVWT